MWVVAAILESLALASVIFSLLLLCSPSPEHISDDMSQTHSLHWFSSPTIRYPPRSAVPPPTAGSLVTCVLSDLCPCVSPLGMFLTSGHSLLPGTTPSFPILPPPSSFWPPHSPGFLLTFLVVPLRSPCCCSSDLRMVGLLRDWTSFLCAVDTLFL